MTQIICSETAGGKKKPRQTQGAAEHIAEIRLFKKNANPVTRHASCQSIDTTASPLEQPSPLCNAETTTPSDAESNTPTGAEASTPSLSQPQPSPSLPGKPEVPSCPEVTTTEELGTVIIHQTITMLLIGDSVIRNIDLSKSLPTQQTTPPKVCVPGLRAEDLIKWGQSAKPTPAVQQATFLVGINSCTESSTARTRGQTRLLRADAHSHTPPFVLPPFYPQEEDVPLMTSFYPPTPTSLLPDNTPTFITENGTGVQVTPPSFPLSSTTR